MSRRSSSSLRAPSRSTSSSSSSSSPLLPSPPSSLPDVIVYPRSGGGNPRTGRPSFTVGSAPLGVRRASLATPASSGTSSSSSSSSGASSLGPLARAGVKGPASERVSDEAMRMLKRMRPEELREISKAATALEKTKVEERKKKINANKKKVAAFVAKTDNFVDLVEDCHVCLEPLLNNIGTTKFGVLSWRCRCTVAQEAHSACVFSKICLGQGKCDMCHATMKFEKTRRRRLKATIKFYRDDERADTDDASSDPYSSAGSDDVDNDY